MFKEGKYLIRGEFGTSIIIRDSDTQRETNENLGVDLLFDLKWINECTFQAVLKEVLKDDNGINYPDNAIVQSTIIETTDSSKKLKSTKV